MSSRTPLDTVNADAGPPSEAGLGVEPHNAAERTPVHARREGHPRNEPVVDGSGTAGGEGVAAYGAATSQDAARRPESFDREHVQELRDEAAGHRVKAKRTDALNARLATAQAALTGKLADPIDLPFTDDLLDDDGLVDEAKVQAAVDDLIERKPHLAARRPTGNAGQGARPEAPEVGLASLLRRGA